MECKLIKGIRFDKDGMCLSWVIVARFDQENHYCPSCNRKIKDIPFPFMDGCIECQHCKKILMHEAGHENPRISNIDEGKIYKENKQFEKDNPELLQIFENNRNKMLKRLDSMLVHGDGRENKRPTGIFTEVTK